LIGVPLGSGVQLERTLGYGRSYAAGTLIGDIFVGIGIGKAAKPVTSKVTEKASEWLTTKAVERGPLQSASLTEKVVGKVTGARPYLAQQVVSVPTPEAVGLGGLEAQFTGWELASAPRSSAVLVSKLPSEQLARVWAEEHLFKRAMGGLAYATVKEALAKETMPKTPYVPMGETSLPEAGSGLAAGMMLLPKISVKPKTIVEQRMPFIPESPSRIKPKERTGLITIPSLTIEFESMQELKPTTEAWIRIETAQKPLVETVQVQKLLQQPSMPSLQMQIQTPTFKPSPGYDFTPRFPKVTRKRKKLLTGLYLWEFPIADPSILLGGKRKRR